MMDDSPRLCESCGSEMIKQLGCGYAIIHPANNDPQKQLQRDIASREERAKELQSKPIKRSHEGRGSGRGKAIGGQHIEVDKDAFIKAAARDPLTVKLAQDALKKAKK